MDGIMTSDIKNKEEAVYTRGIGVGMTSAGLMSISAITYNNLSKEKFQINPTFVALGAIVTGLAASFILANKQEKSL